MADQKTGNTPLSMITRLFFGLLTIATFGGLFLDAVASMNPAWQAQTVAFGQQATDKYLRVLKIFEGVK